MSILSEWWPKPQSLRNTMRQCPREPQLKRLILLWRNAVCLIPGVLSMTVPLVADDPEMDTSSCLCVMGRLGWLLYTTCRAKNWHARFCHGAMWAQNFRFFRRTCRATYPVTCRILFSISQWSLTPRLLSSGFISGQRSGLQPSICWRSLVWLREIQQSYSNS